MFDQIRVLELGKGIHDGKSSELDSHAKIIVIGSKDPIIQATGQWAELKDFSEKVLILENVPIIDDIIAYNCPYSMTTYLMVTKNALHVPIMRNNLI